MGADIEKTDKFIEIVKRYTNFDELDELSNEMVNSFIEKIVVHEADYSSGKREQQVDIHLNFIGNFTAPLQDLPPTKKEIAQAEEAERIRLERLEIQREKTRIKNRKYREAAKTNGKREEENAKRKAQYVAKRNAEIEQAIAEGRTPPRPYKPFTKKRQST